MKNLILNTFIFCSGLALLAYSYEPAYSTNRGLHGATVNPLFFAIAVGICIVGGVLLTKAIKEYFSNN
jgi:hypothetical protein